jgi:hypothetical protein
VLHTSMVNDEAKRENRSFYPSQRFYLPKFKAIRVHRSAYAPWIWTKFLSNSSSSLDQFWLELIIGIYKVVDKIFLYIDYSSISKSKKKSYDKVCYYQYLRNCFPINWCIFIFLLNQFSIRSAVSQIQKIGDPSDLHGDVIHTSTFVLLV